MWQRDPLSLNHCLPNLFSKNMDESLTQFKKQLPQFQIDADIAPSSVTVSCSAKTKAFKPEYNWQKPYLNLLADICHIYHPHKYKQGQMSTKQLGVFLDIEICLIESINNAILHGHSGLSNDNAHDPDRTMAYLEACEKKLFIEPVLPLDITVKTTVTRENLIISVQDQGQGYNVDRVLGEMGIKLINEHPPTDLYSRRGLYLIHQCSDRVQFSNNGRCITMTWLC